MTRAIGQFADVTTHHSRIFGFVARTAGCGHFANMSRIGPIIAVPERPRHHRNCARITRRFYTIAPLAAK